MTYSPAGSTERFGTLTDGRPVHRHVVGDGALVLSVLDLGAVVQSLVVPGPRGSLDVVLGTSQLGPYVEDPEYLGAVVGRVPNRVAGARFDLDGTVHHLDANEGRHTLHGGPDGFHVQLWDVLEHTDTSVTLGHRSPDGAGGFPGEVEARVTYTVTDDHVDISFEATTSRATPLALTQHSHVNLAGEASGSVLGHELHVAASRYTPVDDEMIPTGEIAEVDGTPLDHRTPRAVAVDLDHNLVLDPVAGDGAPAAVVRDPATGLTMTVHTDAPGLQVYAGGGFDGSIVGKGGTAYEPGAGLALEPQPFPDAIHHRGEAGWPDPVATPGRSFGSHLRWTFSTT